MNEGRGIRGQIVCLLHQSFLGATPFHSEGSTEIGMGSEEERSFVFSININQHTSALREYLKTHSGENSSKCRCRRGGQIVHQLPLSFWEQHLANPFLKVHPKRQNLLNFEMNTMGLGDRSFVCPSTATKASLSC